MYTEFAQVYDELMAGVDYDAWAAGYAQMLRTWGCPTGKVCECACGTGSLTIPLQRLGYGMTGVDLSQDMLWIAAQKARSAGFGIPFVRQDMRKLHLHRPMNAVLATCDGLNYLLREEDLRAFFVAARSALVPGGLLMFDVSTPWKLENLLGDRLLGEDTGRVAYLWQNCWQPRTECVDMHLTFFVREEDGRYRRFEEVQRQRAWDAETLIDLLREAGFGRTALYGRQPLAEPRPTDDRWHIAARLTAEE